MIGYPVLVLSAAVISPRQNSKAITIPKPKPPLIMILSMIDRGITIEELRTSSAICVCSGNGHEGNFFRRLHEKPHQHLPADVRVGWQRRSSGNSPTKAKTFPSRPTKNDTPWVGKSPWVEKETEHVRRIAMRSKNHQRNENDEEAHDM